MALGVQRLFASVVGERTRKPCRRTTARRAGRQLRLRRAASRTGLPPRPASSGHFSPVNYLAKAKGSLQIGSVYAGCCTACRSEHAENLADLVRTVLGAKRAAQQGHAGRRCRRPGEVDVKALARSASHIAAPVSRSGMITAMIADCGSSVPSVKPSCLQAGVEALAVLPEMRTLVGAVHELADRGRGRGHHRRRERRGEDIGPADQAKNFELGMVGDAEAADGSDRLGEGADDEVDIVDARPALRRRRGRARQ